jgi:hemerythrin superfamily protein
MERTATMSLDKVKQQILLALNHPEAEEGLYFQNLYALHEEEERSPVEGTQEEILEAIKELIREKRVRVDNTGDSPIFFPVTA